MSYKRAKRNQQTNTSIVQLENVNTKEEARWYLGKRVAFMYAAKKADKDGNKVRTIWGKITRIHGNGGSVRAQFAKALPASSFGEALRVVRPPLLLPPRPSRDGSALGSRAAACPCGPGAAVPYKVSCLPVC